MSDDPVAPIEQRIIRHMRAEHLDDLLACVKAFGGAPDATAADMRAIDRFGLDAVVTTPEGDKIVRLPFEQPVTEGSQVRTILTEMTHAARALLGEAAG